MEPHHERAGIFRMIALLHVARPDAPRRAQLRNLLEEVVVDIPEEREPWCEAVDVESARNSTLDIRESVGEREGKLLCGGGSSFANMVAGDRYRIPLWDVLGRPLETVDDESQRWLDRIDPCVLRHVLLEDVVLDCATQLPRIDPLFLRGRDIEAVEYDGRPVDRH
jgi:hypothetical protein